jgi:hypothetical protein
MALVASLASITCSTPADAPEPPTDDPPSGSTPPPETPPPSHWNGSLGVSGPDTMIVHQSVLLTVTARDADGHEVTGPVTFASSNWQVATVSSEGVVTAVGRGSATITATRDTVTAQLSLVVTAGLMVTGATGSEWVNHVMPSVGDSMQFRVDFVDINGVPIGPAPADGWRSSDPATVSVTATGLAVAHQVAPMVTISATTPDGPAVTYLFVQGEGPPTTVTLVHAVPDVGPITFRIHRLPPVTLQYGETSDVVVTTTTIYMATEGILTTDGDSPQFFAGLIPGSALSLYAIRASGYGSIAAAWATSDPIPADSGLVRLIQGGDLPVVYLRPSGAPPSGPPEQCYFDPGSASPYYARARGALDLLLQRKPGYYFDSTAAYTRLPVTIPAGHAVTLVLTGHSIETASYIAFTDR